jgi:hypothetical protein
VLLTAKGRYLFKAKLAFNTGDKRNEMDTYYAPLATNWALRTCLFCLAHKTYVGVLNCVVLVTHPRGKVDGPAMSSRRCLAKRELLTGSQK